MPYKKAFTLVEIIVVMLIIGILATIAIPFYVTFMNQGMAQNAESNLMAIVQGEKNYYLNHGFYCVGTDYTNSTTDLFCGNSLPNLVKNLNLNAGLTDSNYSYFCEVLTSTSWDCAAKSNSNAGGFPEIDYTSTGYPNLPNNPQTFCLDGTHGHGTNQYTSYCPPNLPVY